MSTLRKVGFTAARTWFRLGGPVASLALLYTSLDEHNWLARFLNAHPNLWPIVILTAVIWLVIVGV